jgi:hypothetical protein
LTSVKTNDHSPPTNRPQWVEPNDVMRVYVDGRLVHTSSTWEAAYYWRYRLVPGVPRYQALNAMLFRFDRTKPVKPTAGGGLYIEEVRLLSSVLAQGQCVDERRTRTDAYCDAFSNNNRCWSRTRPAGRAQLVLAGRFARRA